MFIPFSTDAPIYFWPLSTVGLIAANIAYSSYMWGVFDRSELAFNRAMLAFGDGYHPVQWLTSMFLHWDFMHLLGNMFFLWAFGLVVEGKLGWWKFLLVYLAIGLTESAVTQTFMLGFKTPPELVEAFAAEGMEGWKVGALGASGAIFGVLAMAVLWAPKNDLSCVYLISIVPGFTEIAILTFGMLYIGMELLFWSLDNFGMGTSALHLIGGVLGGVAGTVLLKTKVVDCEGWDLFAIATGTDESSLRTLENISKKAGHLPTPEERQAAEEQAKQRHVEATAQIAQLIGEGTFAAAYALYKQQADAKRTPRLPAKVLVAFIDGLLRDGRCKEATHVMFAFIEQHPEHAPKMRLKLAHVLLARENRPQAAIDALAGIPAGTLPSELEKVRAELQSRAIARLDEGDLELEAPGH